MNKKQGFAYLPITLFIIIVAVLGLGGYFVYHSQNTATPSVAPPPVTLPPALSQGEGAIANTSPLGGGQEGVVTAPPNETANWKTYKNDKYGFEFKYPAIVRVTEYLNDFEPHIGIQNPSSQYNPKYLNPGSLNLFITKSKYSGYQCNKTTSIILASGTQVDKCYIELPAENLLYVALQNNDTFFTFRGDLDLTEKESDYTDIISTFRFTP